jgi:glutathione S-transferase
VYVGAQVAWGLEFGTIAPRPAFERYAARLAERAARQRADSLDNAAAEAASG